jgi:hypothetical protein
MDAGVKEKIDESMTDAAGVEPDTRVENAQVIDSGVAQDCQNLLYGHFPECLRLNDAEFSSIAGT